MPKYVQKFLSIVFAIFALHLAPKALAISIDEVHIERVSDGDRLAFLMSDPIKLSYELKSSQPSSTEDTILIRLPSGVEWNAPIKGQGNGLIKEYTFESDRLTIRTSQHVQIKKDGSNTKGYFLDIVSAATATPTPAPQTNGNQDKPLEVKNIRIGMHEESTRIVLDLTMPMLFSIEQSMAGDKLIIKGQEPVEWKGPKRSFQQEGAVQNYRVIGSGTDAYLEVQTESGTAVQKAFIEDPNGAAPKYIIDLLPNSLAATNIDGLFRNSAGLQKTPNMQLGAGVDLQSITSVKFEIKNGDTIVTLNMPRAIDIPVIDNIYTHQVIISLPKTDWTKVSVPLSATGLIKEYKIDQSLPDKTNLILFVQDEAGVIGKRTTLGGVNQAGQFVIVLSTDNAKVPEWLSEVTAENLPYTLQEKKEGVLATRAIKYRGGALEYTNIGEGLYLTALGGQVAGVNNTATSRGNVRTNLSSALTGAVGYIGLGYGVQVERQYFGLEGLIGYQSLLNKNEYTGAPASAQMKMRTGLSWVVAGRVGYYISPVSLLYGKIGVNSTTMTLSGTGDGTLFYNSKKIISRSGFLFGAGVEAAIDDQLSARIETSQITSQPFRSTSATGVAGKFQPKVQEMLMGVSWKPSPMGGPAANEAYEDSVASGIYMGGEAGLGSMGNNRSVVGTGGSKYKSSSLVIEPLWGVYGGYAQSLGRYYVAGEGQVQFNQSKIAEGRKNAAGRTESFENFLRWSFALTGRFGYIFNHGVLAYGRAGVVASRFSHDGANDTGGSILTIQHKTSKPVTGLRLGGGLEIFLNPALSLRGDYTMDLYPAVSLKATNGTTEKVLATRNEFRLGLAYTFPVMK